MCLIYYRIKKTRKKLHWSVTITSKTGNLDQSESTKINSDLKIYNRLNKRKDVSCFLNQELIESFSMASNSEGRELNKLAVYACFFHAIHLSISYF